MITLNDNQLWGAIMFVAGVMLLNVCNQKERKEQAKWKDPKFKWQRLQDNEAAPKSATLPNALMTVTGAMLSFGGIVFFIMGWS
ncbi:MAG: hypothetical protein COV67_04395 [Nitrospinae bacterium CG11_big_fil_rev_8_21_14_0_20_56_8]|nr:MAG: hypothetical protein COV67_04395 [Nitrospinae bacterium CG11_big_fil_rev_8_21_14_0_20_56_8]